MPAVDPIETLLRIELHGAVERVESLANPSLGEERHPEPVVQIGVLRVRPSDVPVGHLRLLRASLPKQHRGHPLVQEHLGRRAAVLLRSRGACCDANEK